MDLSYSGRCLCGAIRFEITGPVEPPVACHCTQCQRHSGGMWVAITAPSESVEISRTRLAWVSVSERARRGFCLDCGGYLFWQEVESDTIDVAFGALDDPNGLALAAHIFVSESRLPLPADGLPRYDRNIPDAAE